VLKKRSPGKIQGRSHKKLLLRERIEIGKRFKVKVRLQDKEKEYPGGKISWLSQWPFFLNEQLKTGVELLLVSREL
jgi:hypothetical protein